MIIVGFIHEELISSKLALQKAYVNPEEWWEHQFIPIWTSYC